MKKYSTILFAAALLAANSCAEKLIDNDVVPTANGVKAIEIAISMEDTKASLDGKSVIWKNGDKVAVFDGIAAEPNEFTVAGVSGTSAYISGTVSEDATTLRAVYPFSAAVSAEVDTLTINLARPQVIPAGSDIDPEALVSIAKAELGALMAFKNVVSLVKFEITKDNVDSVLFVSNNAVAFTGKADASFAESSINVGSGNSARLKIISDGASFAKGTYYATVLPSVLEGGISFVSNVSGSETFKKTTKSVTFERNGGVNFGDISSGQALIYSIGTKAELLTWAQNAALYPESKFVKLTADIDFEGAEWTPVKGYFGSFDGYNHSIYNLVIKTGADGRGGFFDCLQGDSELRHLKLGYNPASGAYDGVSTLICTDAPEKAYLGSVAACISDGKVLLTDIQNYIPVTVATTERKPISFRVGGVVGATINDADVRILSCDNYGAVDMNFTEVLEASQYVGGIVGLVASNNCSIQLAYNYAAIEGARNKAVIGNVFVGGIVGRIGQYNYGLVIGSCQNSGDVNLSANQGGDSHIPYVGGIIGADNAAVAEAGETPKMTVESSTNLGKVSCLNQTSGAGIGGIVGYVRANSLVKYCQNGAKGDATKGLVEKSGNMAANTYIGGIVGKTPSEGAVGGLISNCTNYGHVYEVAQTTKSKTMCYGGIIGNCYIDVEYCKNYGVVEAVGTVTSAFCVGGIAGLHGAANKIVGCKNYGDLKSAVVDHANSCCGGLIGRKNDVETHTFEDCVVNCTITTNSHGGMLIGGYKGDETPIVEFGTEQRPVKVAGTCKGTVLTADNYTSYLSGKTVGQAIFHTEFLSEE